MSYLEICLCHRPGEAAERASENQVVGLHFTCCVAKCELSDLSVSCLYTGGTQRESFSRVPTSHMQ